MRFLVIVKATKDSEAGIISRSAMEEMGKFNEGLVKDGVVLAMDGLHPSSKGTRVRFDGGRATVTDGPFAETKELVAGFWIVQGKSRAEVVERFIHAPFDGGAEIEIRQLFELEDLDEDIAAGIRERRERAGFEPAFQER
jgi:hypothetical protein